MFEIIIAKIAIRSALCIIINIAKGKSTYSHKDHCRLESEISEWFAVCFNRDNNLFASDETRLSSLIIESDNVMSATAVVWLCEMAVATHRKVIGRLLIYYQPFARMLFFTHVQNVRLRTDDNQSRTNCFLMKITKFHS